MKQFTEMDEKTSTEMISLGFFTGSRRWNVHAKNSDYDYIIHVEDALRILKKSDIDFDNYGDSLCIYTKRNEKLINFIVCNSETEYLSWVYATKCFDKLHPNKEFQEKIKDKATRIKIFGDLRRAFL